MTAARPLARVPNPDRRPHLRAKTNRESAPMSRDMTRERSAGAAGTTAAEAGIRVRWDDANMRSNYANVCNVAGTREEIVLVFGINQSWNAAQQELVVQLLERIPLNPYAAKQLNVPLRLAIKGSGSRYGRRPTQAREPPRPAKPPPTGG